jgi:hypothetical protein
MPGVARTRPIAGSTASRRRLPSRLTQSLLRLSFLFVLSACSSGGGGSSGGGVGVTTLPPAVPAPPPVPFTEWSVVGSSGNVVLTGHSRETSFTTSRSGPNQITTEAAPGGFVPGATLTESRAPVGGTYSTLRSATGSAAGGYHEIAARDARLLLMIDPWEAAVYGSLANPAALGLNYQSFGTWVEYGPAGGRLGVFTAGVPSSAASVPAAGTATYRGFAVGEYGGLEVTATATATADFAKASIALSLTDTVVGAGLQNANLDLSGTLTSAAGANAFAGPVATKGGGAGNAPMSGTADALFYGPGAPEVGGVFWVTGPGAASYRGGFGAKE